MENYIGLAAVYDTLMSGVDYEAWADYLLAAAAWAGHRPRRILDLATGTGSTAIPLARRGLEVTGLDLSPAMLALARAKAAEAGAEIDFTAQNMLEMTFKGRFDLAACFQDGLNYLTGPGDFPRFLDRLNQALVPGGLFIFDLNQVDKYAGLADGSVEVADLEDFCLIYDHSYLREENLWQITVTGFLREGELYRRFREVHRERHYGLAEVAGYLREAGFQLKAQWGIFTMEPPTAASRRILLVAERGA